MAAVETLSVTLPAEMVAEVRKAVLDGEYASDNDVLQAALQDWSQHRGAESPEYTEYLRRAVQEALDDDSPGVPMDPVFDRLEAKYAALAAAADAAK